MKEVRLYLYDEGLVEIDVKGNVTLPPLGVAQEVVLRGWNESWDFKLEGDDRFRGYKERELRVRWERVVAVTITEGEDHEGQG